MKVPRIRGVIRRRILVNYRVDPEIMARLLPAPFRPKLHRGMAIAGICLIRLEEIRPSFVPPALGFASENAAHRVAVTWGDPPEENEGVFVPRRDSDSRLNQLVGGRLFPGEHHAARFAVEDDGGSIRVAMEARDGAVAVEVEADAAPALPHDSVFRSLAEASLFFERGSLGYSTTTDPERYDGLVLRPSRWRVDPLAVRRVRSTFFEDESRFPSGTAAFDHALIMRNVRHEWVAAPDLQGDAPLVTMPT